MTLPKDYIRVIFALLAGIIFSMWIYINHAPAVDAATIYMIMMASSIFVYVISKGLGAKTAVEGVGGVIKNVLYGIDKNWRIDIVYGIISGIVFIIFMNLSSLTMGYPLTLFELIDLAAKMIVNSILAPIGEEALFVIVLWIAMKYTNSLPVAAVITAFMFAAFHYQAYGAYLPAAYVGAFIFRIAMIGLIVTTKSILPATVVHSMVNTYHFIEDEQLMMIG